MDRIRRIFGISNYISQRELRSNRTSLTPKTKQIGSVYSTKILEKRPECTTLVFFWTKHNPSLYNENKYVNYVRIFVKGMVGNDSSLKKIYRVFRVTFRFLG